jgi:hypothetical protein
MADVNTTDEIPVEYRAMSREQLREEALKLGRTINLVAKALRHKDDQEEKERIEMRQAAETLASFTGTATPPPATPSTPVSPALPNGNQALSQRAVELYDQLNDWKQVSRQLADAGYSKDAVTSAVMAAKQQKGQ